MSPDFENVLVAGAGIAGLGAALALSDARRRITILDRDPPPPDTSPDDAFYAWERRGATQHGVARVDDGRERRRALHWNAGFPPISARMAWPG